MKRITLPARAFLVLLVAVLGVLVAAPHASAQDKESCTGCAPEISAYLTPAQIEVHERVSAENERRYREAVAERLAERRADEKKLVDAQNAAEKRTTIIVVGLFTLMVIGIVCVAIPAARRDEAIMANARTEEFAYSLDPKGYLHVSVAYSDGTGWTTDSPAYSFPTPPANLYKGEVRTLTRRVSSKSAV